MLSPLKENSDSIRSRKKEWLTLTALIGSTALPGLSWGCACGCDIFGVGVAGLPNSLYESQVSLQYDYMNQTETQAGSSKVSNDLNPDKQIQTNFFEIDAQHRFGNDWSVMAMVPVWSRKFVTDVNGVPGSTDVSQGNSAQLETSKALVLADIRLLGTYTGFSEDLSTGLDFGLKLPTGPTNAGDLYQGGPLMDRDTQPGTGTTDLMLGGFKQGNWANQSGWYVQARWQHAFYSYQGYRPGDNVNFVAGVHYDGWSAATHLVPQLQLNYQWRAHDKGGGDAQFGNVDSGYSNLFVTPGVQVEIKDRWVANASVYVPVYRHVNGYQQVAPALFNAGITYRF